MRLGKVWRITDKSIVNTLPLPVLTTAGKSEVLYSLFKKDHFTRKYIRVSDSAYPARVAGIVFSERLAKAPLTFSLRPIKIVSMEAK